MAGWPEHACVGCSLMADHVPNLAHLNARHTTLAYASRAPQEQIRDLQARMGWEHIPWYTITDAFDADMVRAAVPDRQPPRAPVLATEVVGVPAWFVHLLFIDDPHAATTPQEREAAVANADHTLGLPAVVPGAGHVLLAAGTFAELVGKPVS